MSTQPKKLDAAELTDSVDKLFLLTRLDLSGTLKEPHQLAFLTSSPDLASLEYLNLSKCAVDKASLQDIFDSPFLRNLEVLGLAQVDFRDEPKVAIPAETRYGLDHKLQVIDLRDNSKLNSTHIAHKKYLNKVLIFAWQKNKKKKKANEEVFARQNLLPAANSELIKKKLINLPQNPLHIMTPSEEQIEFANSLFDLAD